MFIWLGSIVLPLLLIYSVDHFISTYFWYYANTVATTKAISMKKSHCTGKRLVWLASLYRLLYSYCQLTCACVQSSFSWKENSRHKARDFLKQIYSLVMLSKKQRRCTPFLKVWTGSHHPPQNLLFNWNYKMKQTLKFTLWGFGVEV